MLFMLFGCFGFCFWWIDGFPVVWCVYVCFLCWCIVASGILLLVCWLVCRLAVWVGLWFSAALLWCLIVWLLADCLGCGFVCCCLRWLVAFDWSLGVGYFGLRAFGWFGGLCL